MKYVVNQTSSSRRDVLVRLEYYFGISPNLAADFQIALDKIFDTLSDSPKIFGEIDEGVRAVKVGKFQDVVFYSIEPDEVMINAIIHGHRHPNTWKKRKRN